MPIIGQTSLRTFIALALAGLAATGCSSLSQALGGGKNPPDEFAIVTKAPLTVPPDYALKPPRPGETRPQEFTPSERAQQLLVGDTTSQPPSQGELALIQQSGALDVDPNIRSILGAENGGWAEKNDSLSNRILFWQVNDGSINDSEAPLRVDNPEEWLADRQTSIDNVTGGSQVTIERNARILNLPGVR